VHRHVSLGKRRHVRALRRVEEPDEQQDEGDGAEPGEGAPNYPEAVKWFRRAAELGVRDSFHEEHLQPYDRPAVFEEFTQFAAAGKFTVPIAATFPLEEWRTAMEISLGGQARGKLLLLP